MRRPALLFLPVLLAGSLAACGGAELVRLRPARGVRASSAQAEDHRREGQHARQEAGLHGALRGRRPEGREGRPARRRLPRQGLQERQGLRQLLRPQGARGVPDRRRRRHRRLGQEPGRGQRRQPGADGGPAEGRLRQEGQPATPASRAPTRWSSSSTSSRRTRRPAPRRRTPRSPTSPPDLPKVERRTRAPSRSITVPAGTTPPKEPTVTVLAKGSGPKVARASSAVVEYTAVSWAGDPLSSSYDQAQTGGRQGPQGVPIGGEQPSPFDLLVGIAGRQPGAADAAGAGAAPTPPRRASPSSSTCSASTDRPRRSTK